MGWNDDSKCWNQLDDLMTAMSAPLDGFLTAMFPHAEQSVQWLLLFNGFGAMVKSYNDNRNLGVEPEIAWNAAIASVAADPQIQQVFAQFAQTQFDKGLGL